MANTGNGADSTNTGTVNSTNTNNTNQINNANIINNLDVSATTGNNSTENNTAGFSDGSNVINSGDASVDVNVVNIANNNISGDTWWLVFVNDASGNWAGQIMGAPSGATMAGSVGTQFIVTPDGSIIAQNTGNGAGTTNDATVNTTNTNTTTQTNTANINNNITLAANTGGNDASYNTGGSSSVTTGNANVMANILNFVNNNFAGGKVVVSVVNVFGSWLGSFVTPDQKAPEVAAGGTGGTQLNDQNNSGGTTNNSSDTHENSSQAENGSSALGDLTPTLIKKVKPGGVLGTTQGADIGMQVRVPGGVEEDNTIVVPHSVIKTAGVRTVIPSWFWKFFAMVLTLVIVKRFYKAAYPRKINEA